MKSKAIFYHAGCPICVEAEQDLTSYLDTSKCEIEYIDLGTQPDRIVDAENAGIQSVPALQLNNHIFHINFGAAVKDLKSPLPYE